LGVYYLIKGIIRVSINEHKTINCVVKVEEIDAVNRRNTEDLDELFKLNGNRHYFYL